jgi:hypothetical protein
VPGQGPPPKDPAKRARRNPTPTASIPSNARLEDPPALPGYDEVCRATRLWYFTWATSPQATRFAATDWMRLWMLAPLVDLYFLTGDSKLMSEIRLNEKMLGATVEDRQRLHWNISSSPDEEAAEASVAEAKPLSSRARKDPRRLAAVPD